MATSVKIKNWHSLTIKEQIERWVQANRVLKSLPKHEREKHFDMRVWGVKTQCGTVGCAAGQCGLDSWFIKRGLKLKPLILPPNIKTWEEYVASEKFDHGAGGFTAGKDAVTDFFGQQGSDYIFIDSKVRPVSKIIKEIDLYIKYLKQEEKLENTEYKTRKILVKAEALHNQAYELEADAEDLETAEQEKLDALSDELDNLNQ